DFLEGVHADGWRRYLAADDNQRDGVHVGSSYAGDGIGGTRAGGDECYADLAGGARKGVRRVNGRLFMAYQNVFEGVLLEDFVVDVQHRTAGIAKNEFDFLFLQAANDDFSA